MLIALVGAELEENLALRYIWGSLQAAGHRVCLIPFNDGSETEATARQLANSGAPLAGFSMVFTYRAREFAALAARARALGHRGHLVAGGHFAAFNAEDLLRDAPAFDSVALGEGERILCDLAARLDDPAGVAGLVWRDPAGRVRRNAPAVKPDDLDALPPPVHKAPCDEYLGRPIANMLSSRGCLHRCAFCSIAAWHRWCGGARLRLRTSERVAAEMAELYAKGVRIFNFHDDNFFLPDRAAMWDRVRALDTELRRRGVERIAFAVKSRPDDVDEELFGHLKSMGLFRVFLGIEAGTAASLRGLGRGQTLEQNARALAVVQRLDLHACFNLLLLNPDSTLEDFVAQVAFLRAHPRNPMNFCRTEVYAGTPLQARLRAEGRLRGTYWGYGYEIADGRAQRVFEILYAALRHRHYGDPCVHHAVMKVDYEHQLLRHFQHSPAGLRTRVKEFIVAANLNTCGWLDRIAAAAGEGFCSEEAYQRLVDEVARGAAVDNARLLEQARGLLAAIRAEATHARRPRGGWAATAAAASLAAAISLSPARGASAEEMAPEPPAQGQPELVREQVKKEILPLCAQRLLLPCRVSVSLWVRRDGYVRSCHVVDEDARVTIAPPPVRKVVFKQEEAGGKSFQVSFSREEVEEAMKALPPRKPPPDGEADLTREEFKQRGLQPLSQLINPPQEVCVEIWVDAEGTASYVAIFRGKAPPSAKELTAEEQERAAGWIAGLGDENFNKREDATRALMGLGQGVVPRLREALGKSQDPEVQSRLRLCLTHYEGRREDSHRLLQYLAMSPFRAAEARGRRLVLTFTATELEGARRAATHMHEMVPAPQD